MGLWDDKKKEKEPSITIEPGDEAGIAEFFAITRGEKPLECFTIPKNKPQSFKEYVGQEAVKELLQTYIKGIQEKEKIFPHTLIYGGAGMGKTSLAMIIAKELNVPFVEILGETEPEQILSIMSDLNGGVLFIDEIHQLETKTAEKLYQAMEDFKIDGNPISQFTLIGATTEMGSLLKRVKPFYDRFKIILELEPYKLTDLSKMLKMYQVRNGDNSVYASTTLKAIVKNSRGTPRTSIRLYEALTFLKDLNKVFKSFKIIGDGYTERDLKILKFLKEMNTVVGMQTLASYLDISTQNYLFEIEPYLLQNEVILRTPRGRMISDKGKKLITKLERIKNGTGV
jgi:Holliday junction DNA helicase RuvB